MELNVNLDLNETKEALAGLNNKILFINYVMSCIFFPVGVFFLTCYFWLAQDVIYLVCGPTIMFFGLLIAFFSYFITKKNVNKVKYGVTYSYRFGDKSVLIKAKNEKTDSTANIGYNEFYKVRGNKKYLYLFINRNQAYIIKKNEASAEIINLLKTNIKNYKD